MRWKKKPPEDNWNEWKVCRLVRFWVSSSIHTHCERTALIVCGATQIFRACFQWLWISGALHCLELHLLCRYLFVIVCSISQISLGISMSWESSQSQFTNYIRIMKQWRPILLRKGNANVLIEGICSIDGETFEIGQTMNEIHTNYRLRWRQFDSICFLLSLYSLIHLRGQK